MTTAERLGLYTDSGIELTGEQCLEVINELDQRDDTIAQLRAERDAMRERMKELEHSDQMWDEHMSPFTDYEGDEAPWKTMAREFETLRATAQRRLELLRKCEWSGHRTLEPALCPFCHNTIAHKPDCPLAAELKEAK